MPYLWLRSVKNITPKIVKEVVSILHDLGFEFEEEDDSVITAPKVINFPVDDGNRR